jgi:transcription elongation GreA/GreB family factor
MQNNHYLYPQTIKNIEQRLKNLREQFKLEDGQSPTGSNSRYIDPNRLAVFDEISKLENLLLKVKELLPPKDNSEVTLGHKVMIAQDQHHIQFVICSELDVKHLKSDKIDGRLLSITSPLGTKLVGRQVGDSVIFRNNKYQIKSIHLASNLLSI